MSKKKPTPGGRARKKAEVSLVRSSAAEYLTFVAASGAGGVEAVYADENVWLTQKMMGLLYDVDGRTISYHLKNVFADHELEEKSVIQFFRIPAAAPGRLFYSAQISVCLWFGGKKRQLDSANDARFFAGTTDLSLAA